MPLLLLQNLPRHECLLAAGREFPDLDPSATQAFLNLLRTGDEAFRVVESQLAEHDITQGRFAVMMALWAHRGAGDALSPAVIAERTGVTRATVTGLVDTLERDGLASRTPDPEDRRMLSVKLTAKGQRLLRRVLPGHFRRMAWLMEPLSEGERTVLVRLLTKVLQRAAESIETAAPVAAHAAR